MSVINGKTNDLQAKYPFSIQHAIDVIYDNYGDVVKVKPKTLNKFGEVTGLSTAIQTVQTLGSQETYVSSNLIDTISSSSTSDTMQIVVEGHTRSGDEFTFVVQTVTLNGRNQVTLSTPLARVTRIYNNGSTNLVGDIYVYQSGVTVTNGVPQDLTKTHSKIPAGSNSSFKCSTTISSVDYWLITSGIFSVNRTQSRTVDFEINVREVNKVFRTRTLISVSSNAGAVVVNFDPVIIVPKNADIRVDAISSGTDTSASADLRGYLALIQ